MWLGYKNVISKILGKFQRNSVTTDAATTMPINVTVLMALYSTEWILHYKLLQTTASELQFVTI
jgi:hypothetical protein